MMSFIFCTDRLRISLFTFIAACVISALLDINPLIAQHLAFPGAEGGGMFTKGGRGGKVYEVTSLADDGTTGTLRYAVNQTGARTVVFRVSGIITLTSTLSISKDSITIAGQTAPGDGICVRNYTLNVSANQVIIRYIRCRFGDLSGNRIDDAMNGYSSNPHNKNHVIIDHCSTSWSIDETLTVYGYDSTTVQWCISSESLCNNYDTKGAHGYGGIWGGFGTTFHHNLLAHHSSRNPRFSGRTPAGSGTVYSYNLDFRNNVIYNWGFNSSYGGEESTINIVNNYYKYGPATKATVKNRIFNPYGAGDSTGTFYINGNYMDGDTGVTANNWTGVVPQYSAFRMSTAVASVPYFVPVVTSQTPQDAYAAVLAGAGATLPKRDVIDARIITETTNRTATYGGHTHYYEKNNGFDTTVVHGIIDSQTDVGGWPAYNSTAAPADADHDGMPDAWEVANGLNPNDANDRNNLNAQGYTMLEVYLNSLGAGGSTGIAELSAMPPSGYILHTNYPNPFNPSTTISYELPQTGFVTIKIYNAIGKEICVLVHGIQTVGAHQTTFSGAGLASGLYFCQMQAGGYSAVQKLLLIK
jgi:hypothetical protein